MKKKINTHGREIMYKHTIFDIKGVSLQIIEAYTDNMRRVLKEINENVNSILVFTINIYIINRIFTLFIKIKKEILYLSLLCISILIIDHFINIPRNIYVLIIIIIFLKSIIYNRTH